MRTPELWERRGPVSTLLLPAAGLYALAGRLRRAAVRPQRAAVPVLCVGALTAGGAGKTPVAIAVAEALAAMGQAPHFVTRGYGGAAAGPLRVDPARHGAADVGDEPLLLAAVAPCWVARDRLAGARAAAAAGASAIVLDDGFQNPALAKDVALLVVDGGHGFGNRRVLPAGPLREPIGDGLRRADAVVLIGADEAGVLPRLAGHPALRARLVPGPEAGALAGQRVLAFAGIGRPQKFFATLRAIGAELVAARAFPDHHPYTADDAAALLAEAARRDALPVTTAKDALRLPPELRTAVSVLTVRLAWDEPAGLEPLLQLLVGSPRDAGERDCPLNVVSRSDEAIGRLMSNFAHTPFSLDGRRYGSVEAFYVCLKTDDPAARARIAPLHGAHARSIGRRYRADRTTYEGREIVLGNAEHHALVKRAIRAKLEQTPGLARAFAATHPRPLVHDLGRPERPGTRFPAAAFVRILAELRDELRARRIG